MSLGGKQGSTTQTTSNEPPAELKPFLSNLWSSTDALSNAPRSFFPDSTVAGFSPETEAALQGTAQRAATGSPLVAQASGLLSDTIGGKYVGQDNPATGILTDRLMRQIQPGIDRKFSSGAAGSPGHAFQLASAVGDSLAPYIYQNYATERANQNAAASAAPGIANQDYTDLAALGTVGATREKQQQNVIQDAMSRFYFPQEDPWGILSRAADIYNPGLRLGTSTTTGTTNNPQQSPLLSLLGLGLAGAGAAGGLGWAPFA